ncbi:MAG: MrcB family domain-containing protein [Bacteroidota bacterium]
MSLNSAIRLLFEEYPNAVKKELKNNEVAEFIRSEIPAIIRDIIGPNDRYEVQGSPGQGNWAAIPWIAVLDRFITETVQDGYYIVYLFKEDFSGIYLSLNQGVTTVRKQYGASAKDALLVRSKDYFNRFSALNPKYQIGPINLNCDSKTKLGSLYEVGSIISAYYNADAIPEDDILIQDLKEFIKMYSILSFKEGQLLAENEVEADEEDLATENLKNTRLHKRIERNRKLIQKVKKQKGYICEACGFNFEEKYGDIGKKFIEAHHLTPLHMIQEETVQLDPQKDFAVLCSNCHRMVHRSKAFSDIGSFREKHLASLNNTTLL